MSKWGKVGVALVVALTALTGCSAGTGTSEQPSSGYNGHWVDAQDGRVVWCLGNGNQLSCDWANAQ